jgi:hypothetical protein
MLAGSARVDPRTTGALERRLFEDQRASSADLAAQVGAPEPDVLASLHQLAKQGQAIYDFSADCYRYRQVMPVALSEAVIGPEHPELSEGRKIARDRRVHIQREEALSGGKRLYVFKAMDTSAEAVLDADGAFKKAKCTCSFFFKSRLRAGPCRHLVALKLTLEATAARTPAPPPARPAPAPPPAPVPVPEAPAPAGGAPKRGTARREEVVSFAKDVLTEIRTRADDEDKGISEVVEEAWDLVFERIQACRGWKEAASQVDPARAEAIAGRSVSNPVQQTVLLHDEVIREIGLIADRFGASPSAVVNLAWLVARRKK